MSAGVCGKRLGFEEIFGSPSSPVAPSAKRSRCSRYGSPTGGPSDFGFVSEDRLSFLLRMFPSMDREVVESVLNSHNHKTDDAIKSLHALCLGDDPAGNESVSLNSLVLSNHDAVEGGINYETFEQKAEEIRDDSLNLEPKMPQNGSSWVNFFVQEMGNASNWDDVRGRTMKFLEAFERSVLGQSTTLEEQQEIASLKEQVQCLLRDNHILKRAVAIQHEHNLEHEEKLKEVQQLKHMISQYQEQVRTLEVFKAILSAPQLYLRIAQSQTCTSPERESSRLIYNLIGVMINTPLVYPTILIESGVSKISTIFHIGSFSVQTCSALFSC